MAIISTIERTNEIDINVNIFCIPIYSVQENVLI